MYSFSSLTVMWCETSMISQCSQTVTAAATRLCVEDLPLRSEMKPLTEQVTDEENVVEFRSLPRRLERAVRYRNSVRLLGPASEFVRTRQGRKLRLESNLEEEPE